MYGNGQAPIFILKEGVQRTRGRSAQSNNIAAAKAANFRSIACTYGYRDFDDDPSSWKSEFIINDLIRVNEIV